MTIPPNLREWSSLARPPARRKPCDPPSWNRPMTPRQCGDVVSMKDGHRGIPQWKWWFPDVFPFKMEISGDINIPIHRDWEFFKEGDPFFMTGESYGLRGWICRWFPRSMQPIPLFSNEDPKWRIFFGLKIWYPIPSIGEWSFSLFKWPKYCRVMKIIKADPHHIKIIKLVLNPLKSHQMSWSKFHDIPFRKEP